MDIYKKLPITDLQQKINTIINHDNFQQVLNEITENRKILLNNCIEKLSPSLKMYQRFNSSLYYWFNLPERPVITNEWCPVLPRKRYKDFIKKILPGIENIDKIFLIFTCITLRKIITPSIEIL